MVVAGGNANELPPEISNIIDNIIRGSPISVSVADPSLPDCPLIAVSDNFEILTGYSRQECLGRNCRFLNGSCDIELGSRKAMRDVLRDATGKASFGGKIQNRRKDGAVFFNILRLQSIFLGGRRFIVGIQFDDADAKVSQRDVEDLENAVQRRGVLAKWMWSKVPQSSDSGSEQMKLHPHETPQDHMVQRVSVVRQPRLLTPDYNIEESLVILVAYRMNAAVITAMGEGAACAKICKTVAEVKTAASSFRKGSCLACGEVKYRRAEGFDCGLHPQQFVGELSHNPTMVLSATNVPRAIAWAQRAKMLVLGSFLNLSALIELIIQQQPTPVVLLCAGAEDRSKNHCAEHEVFCAYLLHQLVRTVQQPAQLLLCDTAREVMRRINPDDPWRSAQEEFRRAPATSRLLSAENLAHDVDFCLQVDRYSKTLPWYSPFLQLFVRRRARNLPGLMRLRSISSASGTVGGGEASAVSNVPPSESNAPDSLGKGLEDRVPDTVSRPEQRSTIRLFLVRHGEYEGELVQGMAGLLDPQLSAAGIAASRQVSELLASEPLEVLFFSPLVRTMQTAELIARPHKHRGLVSEICTGLSAVHRGDWSGLTPQQVEEHFPGDLRSWSTDPNFKDHGGESFSELLDRTQQTLNDVLALAKEKLQRNSGPIAVCLVGHSSTVASIVSLVQPGERSGERWTSVSKRIGYCSVTLLEFDAVLGPAGAEGFELPILQQGRVVYVGQVLDNARLSLTPTAVERTISAAGAVPPPGLLPASAVGERGSTAVAAARAMAAASPRSPARDDTLFEVHATPELPTRSRVSVVLLPGEVSPEHDIENRIVVLIDALRMSSTLVTAMGQGLESAQLFSSVMEVTHAVRDYGPCALLGGEQKRVLIPGFDRDNSPRSYLDGVTEKTALFLTTNGTRALPWVRRSKMLVLGSFLNASAVIRHVLGHLHDVSGVVFLCSGTERGTVRSDDDELCAGYLLRTLMASHKNPTSLTLDDTAVSVLQHLHDLDSWEAVSEAFHRTPAAGALRKIHLDGDVEFCLQRDRYRDVLPFYFRNLDVFFSHRVHCDIPVRYEAAKRPSLQRGLTFGSRARREIQIYLVCQDDAPDIFETPASGATARSYEQTPGRELLAERRRRELVDGFAWTDIALIACSPAHSCRVTAEEIARRRLMVEVYGGLSAVNGGDWAGLSLDEVRQHYPGSLARWHEDPDWAEHEGESFREVHTRATTTFNKLLRSHVVRGYSGALVIVTHGALVRSMVLATKRLPLEKAAASWLNVPAERDSIALIEASLPGESARALFESGAISVFGGGARPPEDVGALAEMLEGSRFKVSNIGRGSVPIALASRASRL